MKVVEASGSPIVQTLKPKFDMVEGCVLGADCALCENTGNGCGTKNIVYSAVCTACPDHTAVELHQLDGDTEVPKTE